MSRGVCRSGGAAAGVGRAPGVACPRLLLITFAVAHSPFTRGMGGAKALIAENLALRHQLNVLNRKRRRAELTISGIGLKVFGITTALAKSPASVNRADAGARR